LLHGSIWEQQNCSTKVDPSPDVIHATSNVTTAMVLTVGANATIQSNESISKCGKHGLNVKSNVPIISTILIDLNELFSKRI